MRLALFDLDGTITTRDTFFDFLIFTFGRVRFALGMLALSPVLALYVARVIPNWKAKESVFRHFLKGWTYADFDNAAARYSRERLPAIIRNEAMERIEWHRTRGHRIAVVSASVEEWMRGWCGSHGMEVIGTRLEIVAGKLTGRIDGDNCNGVVKARRIRDSIALDDYEIIYAYGNSAGDADMLALADEKYYNWVKVV
jgi:phosphatidylglycerophosphatase C